MKRFYIKPIILDPSISGFEQEQLYFIWDSVRKRWVDIEPYANGTDSLGFAETWLQVLNLAAEIADKL